MAALAVIWGAEGIKDTQRCLEADTIILKFYLNTRVGSDDKESACKAGDPGSIPGSGRSPSEGNGNPLSRHSSSDNPTDGRTSWATAQGVAKSWETTE